MSREESLVAVLVSAEALLKAAQWPACRGQPSVAVPIGVLAALAGAVAVATEMARTAPERDAAPALSSIRTQQALNAGNAAQSEVATTGLAGLSYWCKTPECWRRNDTAGVYCFQCSEMATAASARIVMRDPVFTGGADE